MCSTAKGACLKSVSCEKLYKNWERKCMSVWEASTSVCSDKCKNATNHLYQDQYGKRIKWCDCGIHVNGFFDVLKSAEELTMARQCFKRQRQMKSLCDEEDINQCLKCKAKKGRVIICVHYFHAIVVHIFIVCQYSCDKVVSHCANNTECVMVWDKYHNECKQVISWDGVSVMPMCTTECKRWVDKLDSDPIGKYLKCCKCSEQNEHKRIECIKEKQKVGIVCDIDYNSIRYCQHNEILCNNNLDELFMEQNVSKPPKNTIQG